MTRATELAVSDKAVQDFVVRGEVTDAEVSDGAATGKKWMSLARVFSVVTKLLATQNQVNERTDDTTLVTPKKMGWGFAFSFTDNGYIVLPLWLGGFIFEWGTMTMTAGLTTQVADFNFPLAFPSKCFHVGGVIGILTVNYDSNASYRLDKQSVSFAMPTRTGCQAQTFNDNNLADARCVRWMAFGR